MGTGRTVASPFFWNPRGVLGEEQGSESGKVVLGSEECSGCHQVVVFAERHSLLMFRVFLSLVPVTCLGD